MTHYTTAEKHREILKKMAIAFELIHARIIPALSEASPLSKNFFSDHLNQTVERMSR